MWKIFLIAALLAGKENSIMADVFLGLDVNAGGKPFSYGVVAGSRIEAERGEWISGVREVGWIKSSVSDIVALVQRHRPR